MKFYIKFLLQPKGCDKLTGRWISHIRSDSGVYDPWLKISGSITLRRCKSGNTDIAFLYPDTARLAFVGELDSSRSVAV